MTDSAIDRAAKALWFQQTGNTDWKPNASTYAEARAVIKAIREPDTAMYEAGWKLVSGYTSNSGPPTPDDVWRAMNDAALLEERLPD